VSATESTCPTCGQPSTEGARFCASCGARLVDGEPGEPGSISYTQPEPRLFGVLLPTPTFVLACVVLIGSIVAFATGSVVLGVMLLAFAAALFVLFYGAAERNTEDRVARAAVDGVERVSGWWRFGRESATAWSGAGRRVVQIKRELRPLRAERREVQLALGAAAYAHDETGVASLRARIAEIDDRIAALEKESAEVVVRAKTRVDDERLTVTPTQHLPPESTGDGEEPHPTS
jgi:zinc-ribbon domain